MKETGFILSTKGEQEWPPKTVKTNSMQIKFISPCTSIEVPIRVPPAQEVKTLPTENGN